MKKKSILIQRDIEDQKEEIKNLQMKEKELHEQIKVLEKEVSAHKKEIKTRDVTIGEKEKRIYELKKKNQELDKFKFVLDFKIRELKQQIEPRQNEIMAMRDKIKQMDLELEKFHKTNSNLDNLIGELRGKIDVMQEESKQKRMQAKTLENTIASCRSEVQTAMNFILSPPQLLSAVQKIVQAFSTTDAVKPRVDPEVEEEYNRHREFLQRSILELKKALEQGSMHHMTTNNEIREKNMNLIAEINQQREINRQLKHTVQADIGRIRHLMQNMSMKKSKMGSSSVQDGQALMIPSTDLSVLANETNPEFLEPTDLLEKNRKRIMGLRQALDDLQARGQMIMSKAASREVLPRLDTNQAKKNQPSTTSNMGFALPPINNNNNNNNNHEDASHDGSRILDLGDNQDDPPSARGGAKTYATEYQSPRLQES